LAGLRAINLIYYAEDTHYSNPMFSGLPWIAKTPHFKSTRMLHNLQKLAKLPILGPVNPVHIKTWSTPNTHFSSILNQSKGPSQGLLLLRFSHQTLCMHFSLPASCSEHHILLDTRA
jgi:hypothetical protein